VRFDRVVFASILLALAGSARAAPITLPTGIAPGEPYRLVFVTSTTRDATATDIATYNAFVTAVANSVPELADLATTWTAIGSTFSVSARDNTNTNPLLEFGIPIYNVGDALVATHNADLWDGSLLNPIVYDENGLIHDTLVWTGTSYVGGSAVIFALGAASCCSRIGSSSSITQLWTEWVAPPQLETHALYAISGTLNAIPEPATGVLLAMGLAALAAPRRRDNQ